MIEINLLPRELRIKSKKFQLQADYFIYLAPLVFAVIIFIHICLFVIGAAKNIQISALNNKWQKLAPERKKLEDFKKDFALLSADAKCIQQLSSLKVNWAEKLNKLSLDLPSGIWFSEVALSAKNFTLKGSVISLQKEELTLINHFIDNLKKDGAFFKDFGNLELGPLVRRKIGSYEVIDFVLIAALK